MKKPKERWKINRQNSLLNFKREAIRNIISKFSISFCLIIFHVSKFFKVKIAVENLNFALHVQWQLIKFAKHFLWMDEYHIYLDGMIKRDSRKHMEGLKL